MAVTAQFKADFASFFDAVEEAQVHLKSFEEDAVKINKSLDRMGDSFSGKKVIQEATLMAKAIEDAGGIAKLTDAELARVGKTAAEAAEKMRALGMEVPKNLQDLADATKGAGEETQGLTVSVGDMVKAYVTAEAIMGLVTSAYHALVGGIEASITSAAEAEQADRALIASLEAQGTAMPSVVDAYQGYAAELQRTTVYSDDAATAAQSMLATFGVMPRDMEAATLAAANLAAKFGKDLPEAAQMIGKLATGSTEQIEKLGVSMLDSEGHAVDFATAIERVNTAFAGAAAAEADTYAGRMKQLANAWDNVQESIGRAIIQNETVLTAIEGITTLLSENTGELNDNATANNLVSDAVILLAKGASLGAEGIQFMVTAALAGRQALDAFALGLGYAYEAMQKIELATQKGINWALGTEESAARIAEATTNLKWAGDQINELKADMKAATDTNATYTAAIDAMQGRLAELVLKLEATRGKTRELKDLSEEDRLAREQQTKAIQAEMEALKAAMAEKEAGQKKLNEAMQELDAIGTSYLETLAAMDQEMVAGIAAYLEAGAAQGTLATAYGVTASQIKAVVEMLKEKDKAQKLAEAQQQIMIKLELDYQRIATAGTMSLMDTQIKAAWDTAAARIEALHTSGELTQEMYDKLIAIAQAHQDAIIQGTLEADEGTRASYEARLRDAEQYYAQVMAFADQYTAEQITNAATAVNNAQTDLANWANLANQQLGAISVSAQGTAAAVGMVNSEMQTGINLMSSMGGSLVGSGPHPLPQGPEWTGDLVPVYGVGGFLGYGPAQTSQLGIPQFGAGGYLGRKKLGDGGIVRKPTVAMIGEEGPEAVIPLELLGDRGGGGRTTVVLQAGAVTMNYPIMNDPQARDQIAALVGGAIVSRLTRAGARI